MPHTLMLDICRCHDSGCSERELCLRWLCRAAGTQHLQSLYPYDQPLCEPCPNRIAPQADAGKQTG